MEKLFKTHSSFDKKKILSSTIKSLSKCMPISLKGAILCFCAMEPIKQGPEIKTC